MNIEFTVGISGFTENFLIRIWEAETRDDPDAWVYETTLVEKNGSGVATPGAGHQVAEVVLATGMDNVNHIIRIFGVTSAVHYTAPTGILYEPKTPSLNVQLPVRFKIGDGGPNTPAADQPICTTPELIGLTTNQFIIHRANYGPLQPTTHYVFDSGTGEWELQGGDVFNGEGGGEEFTIEILPSIITTAINDSVVGKLFGGFLDVPANISFSATHLRKLIRFSGSPEYSFDSDPPIGYIFAFQHFGSAGTAKVNFNNGTLLWAGSPKATIDIPRYCEGAFVWDGTNWNVVWMVQSTWVNGAVSVAAGTTLGVGTYNVGNVASGDPVYTITHNLAISGDYMVLFSIESNVAADYHRDNRIGGCWFHHATDKPNKFYVGLQELATETQNLSIAWMIIKR